jgi:hypothetical protein
MDVAAALVAQRSGTGSTATEKYKAALSIVRDFKGDMDVDDWILHFRRETSELTHAQKLMLFRKCTMQNCFSWYANTGLMRPESETWSINEWLDALHVEYKPDDSELRSLLDDRVQRENESAAVYVADVIEKCRRYNPTMKETDKIGYILRGVHPKYKMMLKVVATHATTLKEVEKSLRSAMEAMGADPGPSRAAGTSSKSSTKPAISGLSGNVIGSLTGDVKHQSRDGAKSGHQSSPAAKAIAPAPSQRNSSYCTHCTRTGHTIAECRTLRRLTQSQNQNANFVPVQSQRMDIAALKKKTNCHKCGQVGHWASDCYSRGVNTRNGQRNQYQQQQQNQLPPAQNQQYQQPPQQTVPNPDARAIEAPQTSHIAMSGNGQ